MVTTCFGRAREKLRELDERMEKMAAPHLYPPGFLYGLPVLIKDTNYVSGVRYSLGFYTEDEDDELPLGLGPLAMADQAATPFRLGAGAGGWVGG